MDVAEYLLFIPLLIYGIALSDLFSEYRRITKIKLFHWKYIFTIFCLSEVAIFNIYSNYSLISSMVLDDYYQYWSYLLPPILFMLSVNAIVFKEDDFTIKKIDAHFQSHSGLTFFFLGCYLATHLLPILNTLPKYNWIRYSAILICFSYAYFKKDWIFYMYILLWFVSVCIKLKIQLLFQ